MRRALIVICVIGVLLTGTASAAAAYPKPRPAHSNHDACLRLTEAYDATADMDSGTMRAGDALNWFLYESHTKSVRVIMGKRGDDSHIRRDWGAAMGAWCKAHYPKDPSVSTAHFPTA